MRNPNAQHINFDFMKGVIEDNPLWLGCNIDMCCERNGQFFFAEWKRPDEKLPKGQEILLKALSLNPNCFVYIIDGWSDETGTKIYTITRWYGKSTLVVGYSVTYLQQLLRRFYNWASRLPSPNKF